MKPSIITGEVVSLGDNKLVLNGKSGPVEVSYTQKTEIKRVSPDNPAIGAAMASTVAEIGVGDKLMVTGVLAPGGRSIPARSIYLITKADITQKAAKDVEQWRIRGVSGKVVAVNPVTKQLTLQVASLGGNTSLALTPKDHAKFLRYAPDSIRFDEAKESSLSEIHPGDMLRAIGDKGAEGTTFLAEEVISGAFQTVAGTVISVDPTANEVVIKDLQTKKTVTVSLNGASLLKRFPPEMAERMVAARGALGGARPPGQAGSAEQTQGRPDQAPGGRGQTNGRGGFGGQRGSGVDDMLDRFPNITAADLKAGDMIAISSTKGIADPDRIKAIKLLAGVEPFLRMAQQGSGSGQRGRGGPGGLSIPGLDGISFP